MTAATRMGRLVAAVLLTVALTGSAAEAHRPLVIGPEATDRATALRIPDADLTWAVFGTLPAGATHFLVLDRPAGGHFRARVLVPARGANLTLNPWLALVGPGLSRPAGLESLFGDGEGAVLAAPPDSRELELFQDLPFAVLAGATVELPLPTAGPYYLLIFDPGGAGGSYVIDTGYLQD